MRRALLLVFALAVTAVPPHAATSVTQQAAQQPQFRSRLDLVHLDVSVLDKKRQPVRGLTAADFTVLEDGKPQPVTVFSAIDVPPPPPPPSAKWMRDVPADVQTNDKVEQPEGRLFVILIDDAMLPGAPLASKNAREIARGVVDRLSGADQAAVVYSYASRNSQNFTRDRSKLITAIDTHVMGAASHLLGWDTAMSKDPRNATNPLSFVPTVDSDMSLRLGSLNTLRSVAEALIKAPQRRKVFVYISPGITVDYVSAAQPVTARGADPQRAMREANYQLTQETPELFRRMAQANVTIYSVDPCGLDGLNGYITAAASGLPALRPAPGMTDPLPPSYNWLAASRPPRPTDLANHVVQFNHDFLVAAATSTGGRAIININEFDPGLDEIFEENRSYYLLGYMKPTQTPPGHLHRLSVKVNRPDVTVRTRTSYEVERPDPPAADPAVDSVGRAGSGPVASSALPLSVALSPIAIRPAGRNMPATAVTIAIGLRQPMVTARTPQTIHFQAAVFTPDGTRVAGPLRQTATFTLVPGPGNELRYDVLAQIPVKPGRYEVRVAAHRATDNISGSVYADVIVPDFKEAPLSMSGVWFAVNPGPSAVPRAALGDIIPIVPTATREFARTDEVTTFFRVYQGGDSPLVSVPLTVRIVNELDEVVGTAAGTIAADRFDAVTRATDHRFALQTRGLAPGRYLVTFETTLGNASARRDAIVTVR